ncbi:hypothetical protein Taro_009046 [Colocasia esculenta]|uniref:Uncharacterized protein n=1 Tax=Colocasia esculenta TaxID=4460 RepID=A0A843U2X2_COLES|nr:hypothetical protein [Colocasia esculenta]
MVIARETSSKQVIVIVAQHAHLVLAVRWNTLPFRWPCYTQVQRFGVIQDKNESKLRPFGSCRSLKGIICVRVQPVRRPCGNPWTEETYGGLGQGSLVWRKEYLTESSPQAKKRLSYHARVYAHAARENRSGQELEKLGMKLDEAFNPRNLLLLGLFSTSNKSKQHAYPEGDVQLKGGNTASYGDHDYHPVSSARHAPCRC